jgi:hypothetical protein
MIIIWIIYVNWAPQFGLSGYRSSAYWVFGTIVAAVVFYRVARIVQNRPGINVELAFAEIPPE